MRVGREDIEERAEEVCRQLEVVAGVFLRMGYSMDELFIVSWDSGGKWVEVDVVPRSIVRSTNDNGESKSADRGGQQ